ncbi:MAG: hypothetical protein ABI445_24250 [Polyangia bacterium]
MKDARLEEWAHEWLPLICEIAIAVIAFGLVILFSGCSLRPSVRVAAMPLLSADACASLDNKAVGFTAASIGFGVLAGGAGLSSVLTDSTPRVVVGSVGVGLAVGSGVFTYLSTAFSQRYARGCTTTTGEP